jgi:probable rRNA maturation factor
LSIKIFYDDVEFRLKGSGKIRKFLEKVILAEDKVPGDLNFVFTGDEKLLEINIKFLGHDYYTDVISFVNSEGTNEVSGEIYISIDTVRKNSLIYGVKREEEILRVMVHGILHLCGYTDTYEEERNKMIKRQEMLVEEYRRVR